MNERKEEYDKYLLSEKWAALRNARLRLDGFRCVNCGSPYNVQVHHLRYPDVLGTESVKDDLVTLCRECHEKAHDPSGFHNYMADHYKELYLKYRDIGDGMKNVLVVGFINHYKHLDIAYGGKENLCRYELIKKYWEELYGKSEEYPPIMIPVNEWFRDRKIEKIFELKDKGYRQCDLVRMGFNGNMLMKYWGNRERAESIVGHKL